MAHKSQQCKFFDIYSMKAVDDIPFSISCQDRETLIEFYMVAHKILAEAGEKARASVCLEKLKEISQ